MFVYSTFLRPTSVRNYDHMLYFFSFWLMEADSENLIKVKAAFRKISACDSCPVWFLILPSPSITSPSAALSKEWPTSQQTSSDHHTGFILEDVVSSIFLHLPEINVTSRQPLNCLAASQKGFFRSVRWLMIDLSDCRVTKRDWCKRWSWLSVVQDHDGPCLSLGMCECVSVYVMTYLSMLFVHPCASRLSWE